jgi:redox-sensitive bicupin YhaK (pirin superfamily)
MTNTIGIQRDALFVSDSSEIRVMGLPVWEALPAPNVPYELSDPFILVHEGRFQISPELAYLASQHPHRGFDNLWYIVKGSTSTGHTTGPAGTIERARLSEGSLLHLRTGRGVRHAEGIGSDELRDGLEGAEFRGVLFWVNLTRKDKAAEPKASVLLAEDMALKREGDATIRVLIGEGSPVQLGTPALILDVALAEGGSVTHQVPAEFQGFAYLLEGGASFGANRRQAGAGQLVLMGPGDRFTVHDATPETRFLLMAGQPYGEVPHFNGPFVD